MPQFVNTWHLPPLYCFCLMTSPLGILKYLKWSWKTDYWRLQRHKFAKKRGVGRVWDGGSITAWKPWMMGKFEVLWHSEAVLLLTVFVTMRHLTIDIHWHFTINGLFLNQYGKQPALQLEPKTEYDDIWCVSFMTWGRKRMSLQKGNTPHEWDTHHAMCFPFSHNQSCYLTRGKVLFCRLGSRPLVGGFSDLSFAWGEVSQKTCQSWFSGSWNPDELLLSKMACFFSSEPMIVGERVFHVYNRSWSNMFLAFTSHAVMLQRGVAVGTQWESSKSLNQCVVSKVFYVSNFIWSPLPVEMIQFV